SCECDPLAICRERYRANLPIDARDFHDRAAGCRDGVHVRACRLVIGLEVPVGCEIESRSVWRPYWLVFVELAEGDLLHRRKSARSGERCGYSPDVRVRGDIGISTTV